MKKKSNTPWIYARWALVRLALVIYDIFAVNVSYWLALVIRFYVGSEFNQYSLKYLPAFKAFAPWYTIGCIVIFLAFKLYNRMWKYAGLHDLNRIVLASGVTCVFQILGTCLFVMRMPVTYYAIGVGIQFIMLVASRFSYRFLMLEKNSLQRKAVRVNVMLVGVGDSARIVLKQLSRNRDNAANPVCLLDPKGEIYNGSMIEGVPVIGGLERLEYAVNKYNVACVVFADSLMDTATRKEIRERCTKLDLEVQDYSVYLEDSLCGLSLRQLLEHVDCPVDLVIDGQTMHYDNSEQAFMSVRGKYLVKTVSVKDNSLVIALDRDTLVKNDTNEDWVRSYEQETGEDISFF